MGQSRLDVAMANLKFVTAQNIHTLPMIFDVMQVAIVVPSAPSFIPNMGKGV
jgi:hypothetical protein